jgi:hypothetical protein
VCILSEKKKVEQKFGDLNPVRFDLGTPPFTHIALDLTGPCLVKSMVNKRTKMKCRPLLVIYLSTGAVDIRLMTRYSTKAFMDQ